MPKLGLLSPGYPHQLGMLIYTSSVCEPINPGGIGAYAYVILDAYGVEIHRESGIACIGPGCFNHIGEYTSLIKALKWLLASGYQGSTITIRSNNTLFINQLSGRYMVHSNRLVPLYRRVSSLLEYFMPNFEVVRNNLARTIAREAYVKYLDEHPELVREYSRYFAGEEEVRVLRSMGVEPPRYLSKAEFERALRKAGYPVGSPGGARARV